MPDVGFRLFGDSTSLERAVVRGKGAVSDLDKEIKGINKVMGTLGKAAGAFGIVEAFGRAIDKAQSLRDEAEKNGKAISASVASLARYGDAIDSIKSSFAEFSAETLGFFTKAGEGWAGIYTYITKGQKGIDELRQREAQIGAGDKNIKDLEKTKTVQEEINKSARDFALKSASDEGKKKMLIEEQIKLLKIVDNESKSHEERKKAELEIIKKGFEIEEINGKQRKDVADAEASATEAKEKARFEALSDEEQILDLRKQALDLEDQQHIVGLSRLEVLKLEKAETEKIAQANALQKKSGEERARLQKERASAQGGVATAQGNLDTFSKDRASMSLQELANISPFAPGVSAETANKASQAREILGYESEANKLRKSGDQAGADSLYSKADDMKEALYGKGGLKSDDRSATAKLEESLKAELEQLQAINSKLGGVAK